MFVESLMASIAGSGLVAWFKHVLRSDKAVESETVREYVGRGVTHEDLVELYDVVRKIVERRDEIAEEVSKCSWESYRCYFSGREDYIERVNELGEKEAVLIELILSLSNPLVKDRTGSDRALRNLSNKKSRLIGRIMNSDLSKKIELLFRLQDEGHTNWLNDVAVGIDSHVNSQIIKKRYDELVCNQLNLVMDKISRLERVVTERDAEKRERVGSK